MLPLSGLLVLCLTCADDKASSAPQPLHANALLAAVLFILALPLSRLQCVDWSDASEARQAAELMQQWAPIGVADALELLSPDFVNEEVQTWRKLLHLCCRAGCAGCCARAAQVPCMAATITEAASDGSPLSEWLSA